MYEKRYGWSLSAAAVLLLAACPKPSIESFEVSPRRLCEADSVEVTWKASGGRTELITEPLLPISGRIPRRGSLRLALADTTRFTLRVTSKGDTSFAEQDALVFGPAGEQPIVIPTQAAGEQQLVAVDTLRPEVWDEVVRVGTVVSRSDRELTVLHADREAVLPAGGSSSEAFRGTRISGLWEFRASLKPGEEMGKRDRAPPDRLRLLAELRCTG